MDKNGSLDALTASRNSRGEIPAILDQHLNLIASNGENVNVVSEIGNKHLVNGMDTDGSPFFPRDSSITLNQPPVPGLVTSAPSVTSSQSVASTAMSHEKQSQVRIEKIGAKKLKLDSSACEDKETLNASDSFEVEDRERKRKKACDKQSDDSRLSDSRVPDILSNSMHQLIEESHTKQVEKEAEYLARLADMERLLKEKEEHERQVLQMKDMEQKLLEKQLNETKQENVTAKLQVLKAREDILSNFVELMETEFQCAICNELFVKATSLNCSHVFCKLCISQWRKVKNECPNCRCQITSQLQAIALDSCIDKVVEQFDDEMKQKRAVFVEQRKAEQVKFDAAEAGPSCHMAAGAIPNTDGAGASSDTGTSSDTGNRRAQGRSRGGVTFGPGGSVTVGGINITGNSKIIINGQIIREGEVQPQAATTRNCIIVNNVGSTSSSQSVYVSSYQNGFDSGFTGYDPGVYYGGYDHCYICGLNGHSSSRCPSLR